MAGRSTAVNPSGTTTAPALLRESKNAFSAESSKVMSSAPAALSVLAPAMLRVPSRRACPPTMRASSVKVMAMEASFPSLAETSNNGRRGIAESQTPRTPWGRQSNLMPSAESRANRGCVIARRLRIMSRRVFTYRRGIKCVSSASTNSISESRNTNPA